MPNQQINPITGKFDLVGSGSGGAGTVTNAANLDDNAIVRGDGGTVGVQTSGITIADGASGTLAGSNSGDVTLAGTPDYITIANQVITRAKLDPADDLNTFASSVLAGLLTDETGTDKVVFNTSPTLVTPLLGTPTSGTLTNCTGLPEGGLTLADNTTNNSSTSKHGFLPKLDNNAAHYMDGTGAWSTPGGASNSSVLTTSGPGTAATRFFGIGQSGLENATESNVMTFQAPFTGTLQKFWGRVVTTPGTGKSWTCTVRTDEATAGTMANTSLTFSIADTSAYSADTTNTASITAGRLITIAMTRVSTANAPTNVTFSLELVHS